ncbi:MAG: hypothetical protein EOO29_18375 [Comamonadaceae bacterium]|nr:MAG: hypothetical protein EOO29_18375 [Comamonadaceae bacterium]
MTDLPAALLRALAEESGRGEAQGVSLPRLVKRLGLSASVLMRALSGMGDAVLGGVRGPGWVQVTQSDGRWVAQLTEAGRQQALRLPPAEARH